MAPTVIFIRHAQALHNVHNNIRDPSLTDLGVQQCEALRTSLEARFTAETDIAVIASPMRRTLQTAQLALPWLLERGVRIQADADWQENSAKPCDTGSPVQDVQKDFPNVDFSKVDPVWPDKTSPAGRAYAYNRSAVLARAERGLRSLRDRPEKFVFVVSHSAFLRVGVLGWWFFNSDYRMFRFADAEGLDLEQDESTLSGGLGLSWQDRVEVGSDLPEEAHATREGLS